MSDDWRYKSHEERVEELLDEQAQALRDLNANLARIANALEAEKQRSQAIKVLHQLADHMTEHVYQELASALEAPPRASSQDEERATIITAASELARLRTLFDDAGEGQYNVLNLVESYQRNSMEADERLRAVRKLLEKNGCECPCDHHPDERGPDCEVCLACLIGEAVGK